jgi:hypothetical protein
MKVKDMDVNEHERDYPALHFIDTNESEGTACRKNGYGCN